MAARRRSNGARPSRLSESFIRFTWPLASPHKRPKRRPFPRPACPAPGAPGPGPGTHCVCGGRRAATCAREQKGGVACARTRVCVCARCACARAPRTRARARCRRRSRSAGPPVKTPSTPRPIEEEDKSGRARPQEAVACETTRPRARTHTRYPRAGDDRGRPATWASIVEYRLGYSDSDKCARYPRAGDVRRRPATSAETPLEGISSHSSRFGPADSDSRLGRQDILGPYPLHRP